MRSAKRTEVSGCQAYPYDADEETREFVRYWFDLEARKQLSALARAIQNVDHSGARKFLWCALKEGALNVVVTDQVTQAGSDTMGKTALSLIPANSTDKEDLPDELAHHFEGNTQGLDRWIAHHDPLLIFNALSDANNSFDRARMRNIDSRSGWWGLNNPLASGFNSGAAWFQKSIQPTTKPQ